LSELREKIKSAPRSTRAPIRSIGKIRRAEQMKVHTMFVIGKRDMEANNLSVRVHGKGSLGAKPRAEAIANILLSIKERQP
jgi:threonyl-tRNA synthetase